MSRIKECFKSRWGDDGVIMEADFSQLEVIALAFLSQDTHLIHDIISGVDMHCMSASFLYDTPYDYILKACKAGDVEWIKKRKLSKGPSFQLNVAAL
jgi:DNA polymerase I-like protein with 3'-5' exonuclease and polymerase domains